MIELMTLTVILTVLVASLILIFVGLTRYFYARWLGYDRDEAFLGEKAAHKRRATKQRLDSR